MGGVDLGQGLEFAQVLLVGFMVVDFRFSGLPLVFFIEGCDYFRGAEVLLFC